MELYNVAAARLRGEARARLREDGVYGRYLLAQMILCCTGFVMSVAVVVSLVCFRFSVSKDTWDALTRLQVPVDLSSADPATVVAAWRAFFDALMQLPPSAWIAGGLAATAILLVFSYIIGFNSWSGRAMAIACVRRGLSVTHAFSGWGHGWRMAWLLGLEGCSVLLWSCLLIVPGICKLFSYALAPYLLVDNPTWSAGKCLAESERLMAGHRMRFFRLALSFIGWYLLVGLTQYFSRFFGQFAGILLNPYPETAFALFYEARLDADQPPTEARTAEATTLYSKEDYIHEDEEKKA